MNKVPRDPWGQDYVYIPQIDWSRLTRILATKSSSNQQQIQYFVEALKRMKNALTMLPESIDKIVSHSCFFYDCLTLFLANDFNCK